MSCLYFGLICERFVDSKVANLSIMLGGDWIFEIIFTLYFMQIHVLGTCQINNVDINCHAPAM